MAIKHIGSVQLNANLVLENVLHVPEFHFNLLSIQRLCRDLERTLLFTKSECVLQGFSQSKSQTVLGKIHGGLYSINQVGNFVDIKSCNIAVKDARLWHIRLGHIPFDRSRSFFLMLILLIMILCVKSVLWLSRLGIVFLIVA